MSHSWRRPQPLARRLALLLLVTAAVTWLWAHEGHRPLPSSGAEPINDEHGDLVGYSLDRRAREAIDVQTAPVEQGSLAERLLARVVLVTPWNKHAFATSRLPGRIVKLHVRPGASVEAGQTLAEVEALDLETLRGELLSAQNDVRQATRVLGKLRPMVEQGSTPAQVLLEAETRLRQHQNALEVSRVRWLSLGLGQSALDRLLNEGGNAPLTLPVRSRSGAR